MTKYFDWRIDSDKEVNNLIWLREYEDGTIKVVRETDGIWKLSKESWLKLNDSPDCNVIANSNYQVTDTCLGQATIAAWKANGSPSKEAAPATKEYIGNIFMAPLSVKAHLTHDKECPTVEHLIAMGVEIAQ